MCPHACKEIQLRRFPDDNYSDKCGLVHKNSMGYSRGRLSPLAYFPYLFEEHFPITSRRFSARILHLPQPTSSDICAPRECRINTLPFTSRESRQEGCDRGFGKR